ncbi:MAG TPA: hypothetical protein VEG66_06875 [Thermoplasmata archaeon]|nr:hypothetical protein [Thermoplasmata archaeon]
MEETRTDRPQRASIARYIVAVGFAIVALMIIYEAVRAQGTPFANVLSLLFVVVLVTVLILFAILSRNSNRRDE